jgi:hypothetical protein
LARSFIASSCWRHADSHDEADLAKRRADSDCGRLALIPDALGSQSAVWPSQPARLLFSGSLTTVLTTTTTDNLPVRPAMQIDQYQVSHGMPQSARSLQAGVLGRSLRRVHHRGVAVAKCLFPARSSGDPDSSAWGCLRRGIPQRRCRDRLSGAGRGPV